ncbi:MAG: PA2169 family four-helix-bundle protein [Rhodanobacteraceae bacterium]
MTHTHTNDIRNQKINTLNELIAITRDSAEFYTEASNKVNNAQLKTLFAHMADSKNGLVGAMSREVKQEGAQPAKDGTFRGSLDQIYGDARAKFGDKDFAYVSELEDSEDRLLHALDNVVKDKDVPTPVKAIVNTYLPAVRQQHDTMRDRKWAMETRH